MLSIFGSKKVFLIIVLIIFSLQSIVCQIQIGQDINGKNIDEKFGNLVSLSSDGLTIASSSEINTGIVRVYRLQNDTWAQQGKNIIGFGNGDNSIKSISINEDGTILAIGSPNSNDKGVVRVYKFINGNWIQFGEDINGMSSYDNFGSSISLNSNGLTLAIGSINSPNGSLKGVVKVYNFVFNKWVQQGQDIVGKFKNDWFGWSVSLSSNGLVLAVGAIGNDENGNNSGQTSVYNFTNGEWKQIGEGINGKSENDQSGCSISLSKDGLTLAIGASGNDDNGEDAGHVRIFKFINEKWVQLGKDIKGNESKDWSGWSVSLSSDGTIIAIGSPCMMKSSLPPGYVRVFKFHDNSWVQQGVDIIGEFDDDWSGMSISLSADGSIIAIGALFDDGNGSDSGKVRVFKINDKSRK